MQGIFLSKNGKVIYRLPFDLVDSNMYFIPYGDEGIVIDPNDNDELFKLFERHFTKRVIILLTHEHYDHTLGAVRLQKEISTKLLCHKLCAESIKKESGNNPKTIGMLLTIRDAVDGGNRMEKFMATAKTYSLNADAFFEDIYELRIGENELKCFPAPGHSPGSAIYVLDNQYIFTGDSLIQNTPTILKLPGGNKEVFNKITKPFLRSLDKKMVVFPGHGKPFKLADAKFL